MIGARTSCDLRHPCCSIPNGCAAARRWAGSARGNLVVQRHLRGLRYLPNASCEPGPLAEQQGHRRPAVARAPRVGCAARDCGRDQAGVLHPAVTSRACRALLRATRGLVRISRATALAALVERRHLRVRVRARGRILYVFGYVFVVKLARVVCAAIQTTACVAIAAAALLIRRKTLRCAHRRSHPLVSESAARATAILLAQP